MVEVTLDLQIFLETIFILLGLFSIISLVSRFYQFIYFSKASPLIIDFSLFFFMFLSVNYWHISPLSNSSSCSLLYIIDKSISGHFLFLWCWFCVIDYQIYRLSLLRRLCGPRSAQPGNHYSPACFEGNFIVTYLFDAYLLLSWNLMD